ncbi:MAG: hypothetical protein AVDCRST_MAG73-3854, partial [uncultured Thermomicrobiales bacterium]
VAPRADRRVRPFDLLPITVGEPGADTAPAAPWQRRLHAGPPPQPPRVGVL